MPERINTPLQDVGFTHLTNELTTPFGIGNPENTGNTALILVSLDANDEYLPESTMLLVPGETREWYWPAAGAVAIGGGTVYLPGTDATPGDVTELTYDLPSS